MIDIFISYAREDRERVERLVVALEAHGFSIWWDRELRTGRLFRQTIEQALENARCVIVVWSKKSVKREWVIDEAEEGKARNVLVPVLFDDVKQPFGFRQLHAADLRYWVDRAEESSLHELVRHIREILEITAPASSQLSSVGEPRKQDDAAGGKLQQAFLSQRTSFKRRVIVGFLVALVPAFLIVWRQELFRFIDISPNVNHHPPWPTSERRDCQFTSTGSRGTGISAVGVNLFDIADLDRCVLSGSWQLLNNGSLRVNGGGRLLTPISPSGSYTLHFGFKRLSPGNDVVVYLPIAGRQTTVQFGYVTDGVRFDMLADQFRPTTLDNFDPHNVRISVQWRDDIASLSVDLDDKKGYLKADRVPISKLSIFSPNWAIADVARIAFASADSATEFTYARFHEP